MSVRLNLGSGGAPIPGFINVDALAAAPGVDLVMDLRDPLPFDEQTVDLIYVSHVLEHFSTDEVPGLLREWRRVIRPGGQLLVAVPNLDVIARLLVERPGWFTPPHNPWLGAIFGGQKDEYDFHKTGFTAPWLAYLLSEAGFGNISKVDSFPELPVIDSSLSFVPFGVNISLNICAIAGADGPASKLKRKGLAEKLLDALDWSLYAALAVTSRLRHLAMVPRRRALEKTMEGLTGASDFRVG